MISLHSIGQYSPLYLIILSGKYNSIDAAFLFILSLTIPPFDAIVGYLRNNSSSGYNKILIFSGQFFI